MRTHRPPADLRLLAADPRRRRESAAAREWVAARYIWDEIAGGNDSVCREAVAARASL